VNAEHRADIYEEFGCFTAARVTVVYITTMYVAPLLLTLTSAMYGGEYTLLAPASDDVISQFIPSY